MLVGRGAGREKTEKEKLPTDRLPQYIQFGSITSYSKFSSGSIFREMWIMNVAFEGLSSVK
jgi:hypothetical protein